MVRNGTLRWEWGKVGGYFYKGSTRRRLTLMDNLSLIAALEIYGVESITHTLTHRSCTRKPQGVSDEGGGLHAESNMAALVLFFFSFSLCR